MILFVVFLAALILVGPMTFFLMLALGNFGFTQFGFIDCLPGGVILATIGGSTKND